MHRVGSLAALGGLLRHLVQQRRDDVLDGLGRDEDLALDTAADIGRVRQLGEQRADAGATGTSSSLVDSALTDAVVDALGAAGFAAGFADAVDFFAAVVGAGLVVAVDFVAADFVVFFAAVLVAFLAVVAVFFAAVFVALAAFSTVSVTGVTSGVGIVFSVMTCPSSVSGFPRPSCPRGWGLG